MASPDPSPPAPASEVDASDFTSLDAGTLAAAFETQPSLRRRVSQGSKLTQWPKGPKGQSTDGIPSVTAMGLNPVVLEVVAEWWCPANEIPKAIPVDLLRREARCAPLKTMMHYYIYYSIQYRVWRIHKPKWFAMFLLLMRQSKYQ